MKKYDFFNKATLASAFYLLATNFSNAESDKPQKLVDKVVMFLESRARERSYYDSSFLYRLDNMEITAAYVFKNVKDGKTYSIISSRYVDKSSTSNQLQISIDSEAQPLITMYDSRIDGILDEIKINDKEYIKRMENLKEPDRIKERQKDYIKKLRFMLHKLLFCGNEIGA